MPDKCAVATCSRILTAVGGITYRIQGHLVCATHFQEWEDASRPGDYLVRKGTRKGTPNQYKIDTTV
jgi:hypothetical protein